MPLADAIRKHGFVRWYESQLYEGFAYLVTAFLALIMVAIAMEVMEIRESVAQFLKLLVIAAVGGGLVAVAAGRFHRCLARAEYIAGQAVCPACAAYGKFEVVTERTSREAFDGCALGVRCRKCEFEWTIR
jgi:hypothetical protein